MKLWIMLVALLGGLYSLILHIVEHRSANNPTPENVSDVYDAETYLKWKKYSAEHCRLSIIFSVITCVVTLAMLFTDVYAAFAALFPASFFWQLFSVVLLEVVVGTVFGIVRNYISSMVIEEKYGFNRSTVKTFVFDQIRSLIVELLLLTALALGLGLIHRALGDWMILAFAVAIFCGVLLIVFLFPLFSRIGNKFTPLEEGELKERLTALLVFYGYKVKGIEVMDASRRTTKLNAYFAGAGKTKTIVLYDNLVNAMEPDEICAVFAHELGHGLYKDVLKQQLLSFGNMLILSVVAWWVVSNISIFEAFGFTEVNYGFAYILISQILSLVNPLISMVICARSRHAEYRADRQAVKEGYGLAMITALKKLARDNFAHLAPSRVNVVLQYSHPPLSQRIEAVEKEIARQK